MDYSELINHHRQSNADVTIATTPADEDHATHLGILQVSDQISVWLLPCLAISRVKGSCSHTRLYYECAGCYENSARMLVGCWLVVLCFGLNLSIA
jgi:hypothetical protein